MKAAVWFGHKDVRVVEWEKPSISKSHVLVKVAWAGICGTDRHEYSGPNFIPVTKPHRLTGKTAPLVLGHEFSGLIAETGEDVGAWKKGDRVMANGSLACGKCEMCRTGRYNICEKLGFVGVSRDGAFAEYVAVEAERLFKIPDTVGLREAVLAEPLACGIHSTKLLGNIAGKKVVVIGPGIIGLSCFFAAKIGGAQKILAAGIGDARKKLIEKNGGSYIDCTKNDILHDVQRCFGSQADIVYECAGTQSALDSSIKVLKPGGALMVMGVYEKQPVFPMNDFQEGERRLFTSQAHIDEIETALHLLSQKKINPSELITREVTLDTLVADGFEELCAHGEQHIKIVIKIDDT
ncbi:zinc-binding alcohol dehydrogenase [Spirochaetia bacterium]|nr:zinc-binding alcohol dehydrogenase [Spirochaetia bacterium]